MLQNNKRMVNKMLLNHEDTADKTLPEENKQPSDFLYWFKVPKPLNDPLTICGPTELPNLRLSHL